MDKKSFPRKLSIKKELIEQLNSGQEQFYGGDGGYQTVIVSASAVCSGVCQSAICGSIFCGSYFACGTTICAADPGGCGNNCVGITVT